MHNMPQTQHTIHPNTTINTLYRTNELVYEGDQGVSDTMRGIKGLSDNMRGIKRLSDNMQPTYMREIKGLSNKPYFSYENVIFFHCWDVRSEVK